MIIRSDETADIPVENSAGPMRLHLFRPAVSGRFPGLVLFSKMYQVTARSGGSRPSWPARASLWRCV